LRSFERLARRAGPLSDASLPAVASWARGALNIAVILTLFVGNAPCFERFVSTLAGVRAATAGAAAPQFTAAPVGCELRLFTPVTPAEVIQMVRALPNKQCSTDPMPTRLLKENVDLLAPFLSQLFC